MLVPPFRTAIRFRTIPSASPWTKNFQSLLVGARTLSPGPLLLTNTPGPPSFDPPSTAATDTKEPSHGRAAD